MTQPPGCIGIVLPKGYLLQATGIMRAAISCDVKQLKTALCLSDSSYVRKVYCWSGCCLVIQICAQLIEGSGLILTTREAKETYPELFINEISIKTHAEIQNNME